MCQITIIYHYSDLYQTVLNDIPIVLGTRTPNPATCFPYSCRSRAGSQALRPRSGQGGSCRGWERARPAVPWDTALAVSLSSPFNSNGWTHAEAGPQGPWPASPPVRPSERGAEGRQAQRPGTLVFFRPRVWMPTLASIKPGYIKRTNRRHLPVITPDTSPDKRPLPRPPLTGQTIAATKAFSACTDDINLML